MEDNAGIGGALILLFVILLLGTLGGAIVLRAAVSLYNKMAGGPKSPSAVPEPSTGRAIAIVFVATLVNVVLGFVVGLLFAGAQMGGLSVTAQLATMPISAFVMAGMLSTLLPTTFQRGILVTLCYLLIALVIVGGIVMVLFLAAQLG